MKQIFAICLSLMLLSACSLTPDTWVSGERAEVHNDQFTDRFELSQLNDARLQAIANVYNRYGNGPMRVGLTTNNAGDVKRVTSALKKYGVRDVMVDRAVPERGMKEMAIISFPALVAKAPAACGMMPGADGKTTLPDSANAKDHYGFGCTVESMLAKQMYKPKDLMGKNGFETNTDGARTEAVVSRRGYYGDASNAPLNGESSSGQ